MVKKLNFNFNDIPDDIIPEGEYEAEIAKVVLKEGNKAPYLMWEFDITDFDHSGRKLWMNTSLSDRALFRLKDTCEQLGFDGMIELEIDEESGEVVYPDFVETGVLLKVAVKPHYQDATRKQNDITEILDYYTTHHLGDDVEGDEDEFEMIDEDDEFEPVEEIEEIEEIDEEPEEAEEVKPKKRTRRSTKKS